MLRELAGTPLPTILVIAGLFFVLISLADRVIAKIIVPDSRKTSARYIGIVLVVMGSALWLFPTMFKLFPDDGDDPQKPTPVGPYVIQLYALSSYTAADSAMSDLRIKYPALLGTLEPQIRSIQDPARGTMYRVSFGTFATVAEADQRCVELRQKGVEACRSIPKN